MKLIKALIISVILIIALVICSIVIGKYNFEKVYNSTKDKKLAHSIEKKLENIAINLKNNGESISINIDELTDSRPIEKICVVGPYFPYANELIDWEKIDEWKKSVINDDTVFSIFFIEHNNVIPVKINRVHLEYERPVKIDLANLDYGKRFCIENNNNNIIFSIYSKNYKKFVHIDNKK